MPHQTRYALNGDVAIAYQIAGAGPIDIVLGLGLVTHLDYIWQEPRFVRFVERLASFARVILFDKRGCGLSDPVSPEDLPTPDQRAADIRAVMDAAGSERAVIFGIAESAALGALFAATYPERTSALVLFGGFARRIQGPDYPFGTTAAARQAFYDRIEHEWGSAIDLSIFLPSVASDDACRAWWATYLRRGASPTAALTLARMNGLIDVRHVLPAIEAPTLVLHRRDDAAVTLGNGRYLAERIPGARLVELDGADHLPFFGEQDAVLVEVEQFVAGDRSVSAPDRIMAALLAVEIVDAASLASRLGDRAWGETLGAFRAIVRDEIRRTGGKPVAVGLDGAVARFDSPASALRCAEDIVSAARQRHLPLRAGLHVGEVARAPARIGTGRTTDCDDEIAGIALFLAARVAAEAVAGEVLVSSTVKDLAAGFGHEFELAGDRVFSGLPGEWRLYRIAGNTTQAPSLAGVSTVPVSNADSRRPASALSRREREVAVLLALGLANRQIAGDLSISIATVERHIANILAKLGYRSRSQVAAWAVERGLLHPATAGADGESPPVGRVADRECGTIAPCCDP